MVKRERKRERTRTRMRMNDPLSRKEHQMEKESSVSSVGISV